MKKLLYSILILCLCFLVGCSDSSVKNEEFEEYSSQVLSVMQDIGLITDIPDNTTGNKRTTAKTVNKQNNSIKAISDKISQNMTFDEQNEVIWQTIQSFENKTESDTLNIYTDIFEQTFYIPLIMGDALAEHYKVSTFYGVCSNTPWEQYVKTEKNGTEKTTYVYTPVGEVFDKETFIIMSLDYTNQDNYVISVKQFSSNFERLFYSYLDSDGNFIVISHEDGNDENNYITYSNDGFNGYTIKDGSTVTDVKNKIYNEFTSENQESIRAIKTNSQYTVDEEKWQEAQEKYFGDSNNKVLTPYIWADEEETVLSGIVCFEPTEEITLPARARYLLDNFYISYSDGIESAKTLIIPKTVKGIKKYEKINETATSDKLIDADVSEIRITTEDSKPLESITVEEGSSIFKSGTGHLLDLNGNVVCYINKAHPTGKLDGYSFIKNNNPSCELLEFYPAFTASITELLYENTEGGVDGDFANLLHYLTNLETINYKSLNGCGLTITANKDLKVKIDAPGRITFNIETQTNDWDGAHNSNVKLNLTLINKNCTLMVQGISPKNLTLNLPWSKQFYEFKLQYEETLISGVDLKEATLNFASDDTDVPDMTGITIEALGEKKFKATIDPTEADEFIIPEDYFGCTFTKVIIGNYVVKNITVEIPVTVTEISIQGNSSGNKYGANLTINFAGNYEQFESAISEFAQTDKFIVNLRCADFNGYYRHGLIKINVINESADINVVDYVLVEEIDNGDEGYIYSFSYFNKDLVVNYSEEVLRYYYTDQNGNEYVVESPYDPNYRNIYVRFESESDICDLTLIYHEGYSNGIVVVGLSPEPGFMDVIYEKLLPSGTQINISTIIDDEEKKYIVITVTYPTEEPNTTPTVEIIKHEIGIEQEISSEALDYVVLSNMTIMLCLDY